MLRLRTSAGRICALLCAALLCVVPLAGCKGDAGSEVATPSKSVDGLPLEDALEKDRDELKDGGTIRWAIDEFPRQWNLNHVDGSTLAAAAVVGAMLPSAVGLGERANVVAIDAYVKDARVISTDPRQVVRYRLNRKARWSDGTPITWRVYAAQWKALRSTDGAYQIIDNAGYDRIASVKRGRDDYEVIVTFAKPFAEWESLFSTLYPESTNRDPESFNKEWFDRIPVSAGPFKIGKIDRANQVITIVPNPKWWGDKPKLDRIVMRVLTPDAAIGAFVNGEIDVVDLGTEASAYRRAKGAKGGVVRVAAGSEFRHLTFNGRSDALRDPVVRRAIAHGINREALAKADLAGLDYPPRTMGNHFFVNTQDGYKDNSGEYGRYDPDQAGRLLDQAGWRLEGERRVKDGKTLTLRFLIPIGQPFSKQEAELTQAMLDQIGVEVEIVSVPIEDFFEKHVNTGDFDIVPFTWFATPFPLQSGQGVYANPPKGATEAQLANQQNVARIGSEQIDALMAKADTRTSITEARVWLNQADKLLWELGHSLPLYQAPMYWGVNKQLANVGAYGLSGPAYEDIGFVK